MGVLGWARAWAYEVPMLPFTARSLEEKRTQLGLVECGNHDLLQPYPVLHEKAFLLMPNGSDHVTSQSLQELQSTKAVDNPEI
ncbi:ERBB-3 BINDING PROTEIN 1 [Dionaea muscipula]